MDISEVTRNDDGTLPSFAHPGDYPIIYYFQDGGVCCPDCVNGKNGSIAYIGESPDGIEDAQWKIIGYDVFYEGEEQCEHCGGILESAYGQHPSC